MSDKKKLVVEDKQTGIKKNYNIPNILHISISPSGKKIAYLINRNIFSFSPNPKLGILNLETGKIINMGRKYSSESSSLKWSADSKYIFLSTGDESRIHAIDSDKGKYKHTLASKKYRIFDGFFLAPDTYIAEYAYRSGEYSGDVFAVVKNGRVVNKLHFAQIKKFDNNLLAGDRNNKLSLISGKTYKTIKSVKIPLTYYFTVSPDEKKVMVHLIDNSGMMVSFPAGYIFYDANLNIIHEMRDDYYESLEKKLKKNHYVIGPIDGDFKDQNNVDFFAGEMYLKNKKEKFKSIHALLNLENKQITKIGNWLKTDWLSEDSRNKRILELPSNGIEYYKGEKRVNPKGRIK